MPPEPPDLPQAEAGDGAQKRDALRRQIEILESDLELAHQEIFEVDRHNAWLAQERQRLLDLMAALDLEAGEADGHAVLKARMQKLRDELLVKDQYIAQLERMISELQKPA
jgi:sugar-specific transcriptional regulator TrmB